MILLPECMYVCMYVCPTILCNRVLPILKHMMVYILPNKPEGFMNIYFTCNFNRIALITHVYQSIKQGYVITSMSVCLFNRLSVWWHDCPKYNDRRYIMKFCGLSGGTHWIWKKIRIVSGSGIQEQFLNIKWQMAVFGGGLQHEGIIIRI